MNPIQLPEAQVLLREAPANENVTALSSTSDQAPSHSPVFRIQGPVPSPAKPTQSDFKFPAPLPRLSLGFRENMETKSLVPAEHRKGRRRTGQLPECKDTSGDPLQQAKTQRLSPSERRARIERYLQKKSKRKWSREVVYYSRKQSAERRVRVCGRFVTRAAEMGIQQAVGEQKRELEPQLGETQGVPAVSRPVFAFVRTLSF